LLRRCSGASHFAIIRTLAWPRGSSTWTRCCNGKNCACQCRVVSSNSTDSKAYKVASIPLGVLNSPCLSEGPASVSDKEYLAGAGTKGVGEFALFTRRINSFNARGCGIVFGSLAGFSLTVAGVFAALGAWLILPFAGLEAMALYLAFNWIIRHADDSESLVIHGDVVSLAVREQTKTRYYEFNRVWAKLVVERGARGVRLALRSHGNEIEVGRYLDGGGRKTLARALKARLDGR